jgi:simple sugar transport system ATP-binding protein
MLPAEAAKPAMKIALRDINKHFGPVHANQNISLSLKGGSIYGMLGENGAGKSTLMKILAGLQPADSGEILVDSTPLMAGDPQRSIEAGIGMLQQDPLDVASFTVRENFLYGRPRSKRLRARTADRLLRELSARFGFELDPDQIVGTLSIGQRQQMEIVRLLSMDVRTLILDEPTTGISAEQKQALFDALRALARNDNMIILIVSHKLEDVIALCDEVVVLRAGRLVGARKMPATSDELVTLMFGQQLEPQPRPSVQLGDPAIRFDQVTLHGKRVSVQHFSLAARSGEVIGFAGLDGSGQDLILRAAAGLVKPAHGNVFVRSKRMTGRGYHEFGAHGVVFSAAGRVEEGLISGLTLTEHQALVGRGMVIDWARQREQTVRQIERFHVRGRPDSEIQQLSGGNQQRFLMSLLPAHLTVLSLEQPTRGLDVDSARYVWQQLLARREDGSAILFTSPDLDEIVAYSDRIIVCFAGRTTEIPNARSTSIETLGRLIGGAQAS